MILILILILIDPRGSPGPRLFCDCHPSSGDGPCRQRSASKQGKRGPPCRSGEASALIRSGDDAPKDLR
ncbi:hypothetical protein BJV74DRAFT_837296 [Russula compacta]|nr:hypothetical protein BJV74DRAFT_837296 [Russula compacta]